MSNKTTRIAGWISLGIIVVGQLLPWGRNVPAEQVWDWLFSPASWPNVEWWVWFLAPVSILMLAGRSLSNGHGIPRIVLLPVGIFFAAWAGLFLTGTRQYLDFGETGFLLTFIGMLGFGALALKGK